MNVYAFATDTMIKHGFRPVVFGEGHIISASDYHDAIERCKNADWRKQPKQMELFDVAP